MALDDILQAIKAHGSTQLADARAAHEARVAELREASEIETERKVREISEQKEQKLRHVRQKADAYAATMVRHASLQAKQRQLDGVYRAVAEALAALPDARVEPLLKACVDRLPSGGTIRPARAHASLLAKLAGGRDIGEPVEAAGGFVFSSSDREIDYTFDALTERVLRPATELETSSALFDA